MDNSTIEKIDVEEIMQEIRDRIKERGYSEDMLHFKDVEVASAPVVGDYNLAELERIIGQVNLNCHIDYWEMPVGSGIKGFIKRVIRKLLAGTVGAIVGQINEYNVFVTQSFNQVLALAQKNESDLVQKDDMISELQKKNKKLKKELKSKDEKIAELKARIKELEKKD